MFMIEKETGNTITPDYPVSKFMVQLEQIKKYYEKQAKASKITNRFNTFK